jgi:hypothetical protein
MFLFRAGRSDGVGTRRRPFSAHIGPRQEVRRRIAVGNQAIDNPRFAERPYHRGLGTTGRDENDLMICEVFITNSNRSGAEVGFDKLAFAVEEHAGGFAGHFRLLEVLQIVFRHQPAFEYRRIARTVARSNDIESRFTGHPQCFLDYSLRQYDGHVRPSINRERRWQEVSFSLDIPSEHLNDIVRIGGGVAQQRAGQ